MSDVHRQRAAPCPGDQGCRDDLRGALAAARVPLDPLTWAETCSELVHSHPADCLFLSLFRQWVFCQGSP